ncbi:MAG: ABC transporter substrate-binding protein [Candidatus Acidiferrales bacterium]
MLVLTLALTACGSSSPSSSSSSSLPIVRLQGLSGGLSAVAIKVMGIQGFDKANGFTGEYQYINADAATQNFVLGHSDVDFDAGPPDNAIAAQANYDIVSFSAETKDNVSVIVPANSPYTSMQSLKGKEIGWFGSDSTAAIEISLLLQNQGLNFFHDFQFVSVSPAAEVPLLKSGQVQAIVTFQPYASWAQFQIPGGVRTIYVPGADWQNTHPGGSLWTAIVGTHRSWLNANPALALDVLRAWCQTASYMDKNMSLVVKQPQIQQLLAPVTADGLDAMAQYVQKNQLFACGWSQSQLTDVNAFLDAMAAQGTLFKHNPGNLFISLPGAGG